jgi:hypothetical protein
MENLGNMEAWKEFLNKPVKLVYDDGGIYPSKKIGVCLKVTETHLILKINSHNQAILLSKILRVEENDN